MVLIIITRAVHITVHCAIFVALAVALSEKAGAEGLCTSPSPTELTIESSHAEPRYTDEKTFAELHILADAWGVPSNERRAHPLLVVSTSVQQEVVVVDAGVTKIEAGVFCPVPRAVVVRLSFVDRWIVVAHEAAVSPNGNLCVARVLREHGERIIRTEDQILAAFVNSFSEHYGTKFAALKQIPGPNEAETNIQFASGVRRLLEAGVLQLIAKRNDVVSEAIDSPKEIQRLRGACKGAVGQTEAVLARKH